MNVSYAPRGVFITRDLYVGDMTIHAITCGANREPGKPRGWSIWWHIPGATYGHTYAVTDDFGQLIGVPE